MWDAPVDIRHYRLVPVFYKLFVDRSLKVQPGAEAGAIELGTALRSNPFLFLPRARAD